jgi:hypothetical protein
MARRSDWTSQWLWAGLLVGATGCGLSTDDSGGKGGGGDTHSGADLHGGQTGLYRAADCDDLLTRIQDDAIAKLELAVELYKNNADQYRGGGKGVPGEVPVDDVGDGVAEDPGLGDDGDGVGAPSDGPAPTPGTGSGNGGESDDGAHDPTGASDTNTQVVGVDEADFVKVAEGGKHMYLLHGNRLQKLKSWPAASTALEGDGLEIEGSPSEMFVNDAGKAVVFSSVFGYGSAAGGRDFGYCGPDYCGGSNFTKITIADVSGATPKTVRELYYEGWYVSSRRYGDVVRVVMQAESAYDQLYYPNIQWYDAFGRPYGDDDIAEQLAQWQERTARAIRNTKLSDWMPLVQEAKGDTLSDVAPDCGSYYIPQPGLTSYGLTHVLSVDMTDMAADIGGVTVMGATSTVYSNADKLVLAQPDYRAYQTDYGFIDLQQTALHVFGLSGADTKYQASGFIPGMLAGNITQFALDEKDGVVRAATTGWERVNPEAAEYSDAWWQTASVNRVVTAQAVGSELKVLDELSPLGHAGETIRSSRFIGERGYIVTALQTDPLIVVDMHDAKALAKLGEVQIPGFSEYMHPLDETHLVTLGQNGSQWGLQLQIFDVSDATAPKQTAVLDFGNGTGSEASYQHKAFTYYAEKKLLAVPLYNYNDVNGFQSGLAVVKVDAASGFTNLGTVDHSALIQAQQCGYDDGYGNYYEEPCYSYYPEVRRGHFVSDDDATYVYSFSYGGVLVHDVAHLDAALGTVQLPTPEWSAESWHGVSGVNGGGGGVKPVDGRGDVGTTEPAPPPDQGASDDGVVEG